MRQLRTGVIGVGHMGINHVRIMSEEKTRFNLVGIYDADAERASSVGAQYNVQVFNELERLLEKVEAVVIAVPSVHHKKVGMVVAERGISALIEKPMAIDVSEAKQLLDAYNKQNLILQIGHVERFNPVFEEMKKIVDKKKVFYIESHRFGPFSGNGRITDVGVVEDLMIHDIDLVCRLMSGIPITDIQAQGEKVRSNNLDFATAMIQFGGNVHAVISSSRVSQNKERSMSVHTEDSLIRADLLERSLSMTENTDLIMESAGGNIRQEGVVKRVFVPMKEPLRQELSSFYESIVEQKEVEVSGKDGIDAVQVCADILAITEKKRK